MLREQQGFCEGRIEDIEGKLGACQVIDVKELEQNGCVVFGVTVTIENLDTEELNPYKIVGDDEADFKINKISVNSPIARGLLGKNEGDEAKIVTPQGEVEYEIVKCRISLRIKDNCTTCPLQRGFLLTINHTA